MTWVAKFQPVWTASLLPNNATKWELAVDGTSANIDAGDPVDVINAWRSDVECPSLLLPYLAIERAVEEWDSAWPENRQREIVRSSFEYHRHQGTRRALNIALGQLGYQLSVVEWFQRASPGIPYTFSISVTLDAATTWLAEDREQIVRVANRAKNAHTMLTDLRAFRSLNPAIVYVAAYSRMLRTIKISTQPIVSELPAYGLVRVAGYLSRTRYLKISPRAAI